jgi:hypothetical protein
MDRSQAAECGTKQQHTTKQAALDHRAALMRGGSPGSRIHVYRCQHCRSWHVGHKPKPKRNRR